MPHLKASGLDFVSHWIGSPSSPRPFPGARSSLLEAQGLEKMDKARPRRGERMGLGLLHSFLLPPSLRRPRILPQILAQEGLGCPPSPFLTPKEEGQGGFQPSRPKADLAWEVCCPEPFGALF